MSRRRAARTFVIRTTTKVSSSITVPASTANDPVGGEVGSGKANRFDGGDRDQNAEARATHLVGDDEQLAATRDMASAGT